MALSKTRRTELEAELLQVMDKLDALKVELREQLADHRDQAKLHSTKLEELRDILSGREGEQTLIPGTESGTVKPAAPRPAKTKRPERNQVVYDRHGHPRTELTRWTCDLQAKRVPTFVVEMTGLRTKAQVIAKYGDGVTFEKGKPSPKPPSAKKATPARSKASPTFNGITWIATDGSRTEFEGEAGGMRFRLTHREDNRWELEDRSQRERSWHTVGVTATRAEAEERVCLVVEGLDLPRMTTQEANAEKCLECKKPAGDPSPGCWECDHGRSKAELEAHDG